MMRAMFKSSIVACILLVVVACGVCLAETVNINPHKIVLNAEGAFDDVQANVSIILDGARIVDFDVTLTLEDDDDNTVVAYAESAFYCVTDNILIVGFDRTSLQEDEEIQEMANKTVTATVTGTVTVENFYGEETTTSFSGSDLVEIVAPGNKR